MYLSSLICLTGIVDSGARKCSAQKWVPLEHSVVVGYIKTPYDALMFVIVILNYAIIYIKNQLAN